MAVPAWTAPLDMALEPTQHTGGLPPRGGTALGQVSSLVAVVTGEALVRGEVAVWAWLVLLYYGPVVFESIFCIQFFILCSRMRLRAAAPVPQVELDVPVSLLLLSSQDHPLL